MLSNNSIALLKVLRASEGARREETGWVNGGGRRGGAGTGDSTLKRAKGRRVNGVFHAGDN